MSTIQIRNAHAEVRQPDLADFDSFADYWEYAFHALWTDEQRAAWYARWEALGIPVDEVEPRRRRESRLSGAELIAELDWLRDAGVSPALTLQELRRSRIAVERLCNRHGRADLSRWVHSAMDKPGDSREHEFDARWRAGRRVA